MDESNTAWFRKDKGIRAAMLALAAAGCLVGVVTVAPSPASAAASFTARASAEGVRLSTYAGGAPVSNEPAEVGSPVTEATLDSLGTSQAYASALYPGTLLVSLPGLIAGVSNGQLTPPNYPLIAVSDRQTAPERQVAAPGVTMRASSSDTRSVATAVVGSVIATATTEVDGGRVSSTSQSEVVGLTSDLLKIGNLRSRASVVLEADGTIQRSSTFEVSGLEVAGKRIALDRGGLVIADQKVAPPTADALEKALAPAGVQLRLLDSVETPQGIIGEGLELSVTRDIGGSVTPVTLRLRFGRALATVGRTGSDLVGAPLPPEPAPASATQGSATPASTAPASSGPSPADAAASSETPRPPAFPGPGATAPVFGEGESGSGVPSGAHVPSPGGVAPAAPGPAPEAAFAPARPANRLRLANAATRFDTRKLYLGLAAIAALAGGGVFLVARFGVRV